MFCTLPIRRDSRLAGSLDTSSIRLAGKMLQVPDEGEFITLKPKVHESSHAGRHASRLLSLHPQQTTQIVDYSSFPTLRDMKITSLLRLAKPSNSSNSDFSCLPFLKFILQNNFLQHKIIS